jgi:serine/threonine-protein kinase
MSPEQASGDKAIDGRSDEYALACVLYELLVGQPPFTGPTAMAVIARHTMDPVPSVRTVRNTIAVELEGALMKGLAKVPADRFATVQQFVEAVTGHGYTGTLPTPLGAGTAPRAWVKPVGIGVGAAVVVIALVVLARQLDFRALFAPAVEERIAVVDFDASITDPAVSYLGEAIPEFLSDRGRWIGGW